MAAGDVAAGGGGVVPIQRRWKFYVLGQYILDGPGYVYETRKGSHVGHAEDFRLENFMYGTDPQVSLSVYSPDLLGARRAPKSFRPVVRRVMWDSHTDMQRGREAPVDALEIRVEFFRISYDDFDGLDRALRELDGALRGLPGPTDGFEARRLYAQMDPKDKSPWEEYYAILPPGRGHRRRVVRYVGETRFDVGFTAGLVPELNAVWRKLWRLLDGIAERERPINLEERYSGLTPEQYADALKSVGWDVEAPASTPPSP